MKQLYILNPIPGVSWSEYDTNYGIVVRAESESEARAFAQAVISDEKGIHADAWLNPRVTSCDVLPQDGDTGVIIVDFNAG